MSPCCTLGIREFLQSPSGPPTPNSLNYGHALQVPSWMLRLVDFQHSISTPLELPQEQRLSLQLGKLSLPRLLFSSAPTSTHLTGNTGLIPHPVSKAIHKPFFNQEIPSQKPWVSSSVQSQVPYKNHENNPKSLVVHAL